jgi:hypothetical protein
VSKTDANRRAQIYAEAADKAIETEYNRGYDAAYAIFEKRDLARIQIIEHLDARARELGCDVRGSLERIDWLCEEIESLNRALAAPSPAPADLKHAVAVAMASIDKSLAPAAQPRSPEQAVGEDTVPMDEYVRAVESATNLGNLLVKRAEKAEGEVERLREATQDAANLLDNIRESTPANIICAVRDKCHAALAASPDTGTETIKVMLSPTPGAAVAPQAQEVTE